MSERISEKQPEKSEKAEPKLTEYVVLKAEEEDGPWDVVGRFEATGQRGAKKGAAALVSEKAEEGDPVPYFIAVPVSAYVPERPQIKTQISF